MILCGSTLLLAACQPTPPTAAVPEPTAAVREHPVAAELEPAPEQPASVAAPQRWQFTTLVTGAAPTHDALVGANGFYELEIDGDTATVRKLGQTGTPQLPADKQLIGTGTLLEASNAEWPSARRQTLEIELVGVHERRVLVFDLWFFADELHGTWAAPNRNDDARVGNSWGLVQGRPSFGGEPIELRHGGDSACMVCVRAFWNCDGLSFDEPACNSADSARSRCDAQLEQARASQREVPRGCGDFMM